MAKTILFGERVEKTQDNKYGWNVLYDSREKNPKVSGDSLLGKRSVIFFPGDGSHSEEAANGCCKVVQNMLLHAGVSKENMPHLYGLAYVGGEQKDHRTQVLTQLKQTRFGADYISKDTSEEDLKYYQPFFDHYILPLMTDDKGHPRSPSEIRQNLQNVTFASHCHGGFMAYQMEKMMAEKLTELYPKEMPELMSNVRMIHFSSRRPKGKSFAKHLDIISQSDSDFADESYLEYDDIHRQIHRTPLSEKSALISVSPNEEILLLEKVSDGVSEDANQDADHSRILNIFSGGEKNPVPENAPVIQLTQQMLRHFVEHPEDKKSVEAQLKGFNPSLVDKNVKSGQNFLTQEKEAEQIRRGALSLASEWGEHLGAHLARREKSYWEDYDGQRRLDTSKNDMLRERDDEGRFLFDELVKQYQKTGDSRSLISFIKDVGFLPKNENGNLAISAIQNHDWRLFNALKGDTVNFYVEPDQLQKIIAVTPPEDLYRLIPFLEPQRYVLQKKPEALGVFVKKIKGVKKVIHKALLEAFLQSQLRGCFYGNPSEKDTLAAVIKQASPQERRTIKSLLAKERQKKAAKLVENVRERDKDAPKLLMKEVLRFNGLDRRQWPGTNLTDLLKFKEAQKKHAELTFEQFMMDRERAK